jgi:hypothetical protein
MARQRILIAERVISRNPGKNLQLVPLQAGRTVPAEAMIVVDVRGEIGSRMIAQSEWELA